MPKPATVVSGSDAPSFLRLHVTDKPGVLADLTGILSVEGISIDSVIQHPTKDGEDGVPLVIMTHACSATAIDRAVKALDHNPAVTSPISCLPVINE